MWHTRKPADWVPWEHGLPFSWNHTLAHGDKPADWGDKSQTEIEAGSAPYFMEVETDADSRIESRTERIDGRRETWDFQYDDEGRLPCVSTDTDWVQEFEYDAQGRRRADHDTVRDVFTRTYEYGDDNRLLSAGKVRYEHDENGFRCTRIDGESVTRYQYAGDYRLLGALMPDGRAIAYDHDESGQRSMKYVDGQPVEAYLWRDFIRLGAFYDGEHEFVFNYEEGERLPYSMTVNGSDYTLEYDQVGTLKAVVYPTGNVVKAIQYDVFGNLLWDSNPGLRIPLGFAGGLSDPDTGFVRFGWRDYDPDTGRWTAQDPIGDAGGDDDWYGYCLDDPVNLIDPKGLMGSKPGLPDESRAQKRYWKFKSESGACEACAALDGVVFKDKPGPVHPNCRCSAEEIWMTDEEAKKYTEWKPSLLMPEDSLRGRSARKLLKKKLTEFGQGFTETPDPIVTPIQEWGKRRKNKERAR